MKSEEMTFDAFEKMLPTLSFTLIGEGKYGYPGSNVDDLIAVVNDFLFVIYTAGEWVVCGWDGEEMWEVSFDRVLKTRNQIL